MWYKIGWLVKFPYILFLTWEKKILYLLIGGGDYAKLQKLIYSIPQFTDSSDKFHKIRDAICSDVVDINPISVLDVGTGAGWQAVALRNGGITSVTGIDLILERINYCKKKYPDKGIDFLQMDVTDLKFPDKYFDATVVSAMLHDLPRDIRNKGLTEISRVTKRRVVIFEPRTFKSPILRSIYGILGGLLDESGDFTSYANANIKNELAKAGLCAIKERLVWGNLMSILVCDVRS